MAQYVFDTMSQSDASAFTTADYLFFLSGGVSTLGVVDTGSTTTITALGTTTTDETITLTENGKSLTFGATALSQASINNHVVFNNDIAIFGTEGNNTTLATTGGTAGHAAVAFGFAGNDSIVGGTANDTLNGGDGNDTITGSSGTTDSSGHFTESDWLLGGNGADSISGGAGNDHIYGNVAIGAAGAADGNDTIAAGAGNDYVNGNAGNDTISGEAGNDRLYGGNGADVIDGGNGNDYLQGNKGADNLTGGNGNDTIHGGADNDIIAGTAGNNQLYGDAGADSIVGGTGNDTIAGGVGYDTVTGGTGNDTFWFASGDNDVANLNSATTATGHGTVDVITDFATTVDKLSIGFSVTNVDTATTTFANVDDAYTYAKGILAGHGTDVAMLHVGTTDTYVFWDSTHSTGTIDSVVDLTGAGVTVVKADFV